MSSRYNQGETSSPAMGPMTIVYNLNGVRTFTTDRRPGSDQCLYYKLKISWSDLVKLAKAQGKRIEMVEVRGLFPDLTLTPAK